jgi:cell division protein FtsX
MELKNYLISIIVFGIVVTAFWYSFVDVGDKYGVTVGNDYTNIYGNISDTMEDTRGNARDIRDDIRSTEADQDDQFGGSLIKGAYNSLRLVWNSFTSVNTITEQIQSKIGIPDYFILGFLAIVIILISFAVISAVFKHPL